MSDKEKAPAKLSSKLLGMKFMRQAEIREETKEVEEKEAKLKDLSEWKSPYASTLKKSFAAKPKVQSMGFSSINTMTQGTGTLVGRRVFGAKEEPKKEKKIKMTEENYDIVNEDVESEDDDDAIENLWKQTQESNELRKGKGNFNKKAFKNRNSDKENGKNKRSFKDNGESQSSYKKKKHQR